MDHIFTVEEIRKAFWKAFHQSGEHFFPYPSEPWHNTDPEYGSDYTEAAWNDFLDTLKEDMNHERTSR